MKNKEEAPLGPYVVTNGQPHVAPIYSPRTIEDKELYCKVLDRVIEEIEREDNLSLRLR